MRPSSSNAARYAWHYWLQSELRRMLYAGSLFDDKGNLNASLGAHEFKIEVAQAGEDGAGRPGVVAESVAGHPNARCAQATRRPALQ